MDLKLILIIITIWNLNLIKCEEGITPALDALTAAEKDLQASTLTEPLLTTLEPLLKSEISSISPLNNDQDLSIEATPSWELIYPEQNSSMLTQSSLSATTTTTSSPAMPKVVLNLPKYFKVDDVTNCQKYFGQCLRQVLSIVFPKLKDGNQFLNIPPLDPIYFNSTAFQYNSGPFTGYITIRYALIYGLASMTFKKVDFQKLENQKFKARLSMVVPQMSVIGSYKGDMKVNNVRVRPRGDFNLTMNGLGLEMLTLGMAYSSDNHTFLKFLKSNVTTSLKDSKVNATGIFPEQRLNDVVVNVANQYWRDLFNIVLPETRNNWSPILLDALNGALAMVPFDFY